MSIDIREIQELETFFASVTLPDKVKLNAAITWSNLNHHVPEHLALLKVGNLPTLSPAPGYGICRS